MNVERIEKRAERGLVDGAGGVWLWRLPRRARRSIGRCAQEGVIGDGAIVACVTFGEPCHEKGSTSNILHVGEGPELCAERACAVKPLLGALDRRKMA